MTQNTFSIDAASAMVPDLEAAFLHICQLRIALKRVFRRLDDAGNAPTENAFAVHVDGAGPLVSQDRAALRALHELITEEVDRLQAAGCLVKGLDPPLVEWRSKTAGRDILLCWALGDKGVGYWRDVDEAFGERRPISDLS